MDCCDLTKRRRVQRVVEKELCDLSKSVINDVESAVSTTRDISFTSCERSDSFSMCNTSITCEESSVHDVMPEPNICKLAIQNKADFAVTRNSETESNNGPSDGNEKESNNEPSVDNRYQLQLGLRNWAVKHSITHVAINDLLTVLNPICVELPKDARTLLKTPRNVSILEIAGGSNRPFRLTGNILKK